MPFKDCEIKSFAVVKSVRDLYRATLAARRGLGFCSFILKLNSIHKCFLSVYKAELKAMLHRIQISKNTCKVKMQVKRAIG